MTLVKIKNITDEQHDITGLRVGDTLEVNTKNVAVAYAPRNSGRNWEIHFEYDQLQFIEDLDGDNSEKKWLN